MYFIKCSQFNWFYKILSSAGCPYNKPDFSWYYRITPYNKNDNPFTKNLLWFLSGLHNRRIRFAKQRKLKPTLRTQLGCHSSERYQYFFFPTRNVKVFQYKSKVFNWSKKKVAGKWTNVGYELIQMRVKTDCLFKVSVQPTDFGSIHTLVNRPERIIPLFLT